MVLAILIVGFDFSPGRGWFPINATPSTPRLTGDILVTQD